MAFELASLRSRLGFSGRAGFWKLLALVFALLNLKSLPFVWHMRLFKGLFDGIRSSRIRLASKVGPAALFQPMISSSRSGFLECDYNLHKSNSTYFSDFDVARVATLVSLCGNGIDITRKELAKELGTKDRFGIALGGVSCDFRREIKPYEGFEIWTRLLSWDNKWFYGISHFVKKGAVKPTGYTLQPWKKGKASNAESSKIAPGSEGGRQGPHPAIFATAIAKYVFKKGRRTIPPERVFRAAGLLPPRPADQETPPVSITPDTEASTIDAAAASIGESFTANNAGDIMAASLAPKAVDGEWTWERIEAERKRGLRVAEFYIGDKLNEEFDYEGKPALGHY
ncbi:MAG: hypothetical protein ASARMPREDX12_003701 [Alectoria sarmentosa]|nr:MAG: hypothetical protein ASARMPREDX12_003701 [Alectoria sarmentosa]